MGRERGGPEREAVEARACRLFLDGYAAERLDRETIVVHCPDGTRYRVDTLFGTCTCQAGTVASEQKPCEHLLGYGRLLAEQQDYEEALLTSCEARYGPWGLTLENDRTERELREIGVCEF